MKYHRSTNNDWDSLRSRQTSMRRLADVLTKLRLDIAVSSSRRWTTTTEELWMELAELFPVQALVIDPLTRWPARWLWRGAGGQVVAVIIGGA